MHRTVAVGVVALFSLSALVAGCANTEPEEETAASEDELEQNGCHTADAPNDDVANLQRYATYRERLRREFVKVSAGDEPGTNIPASNRQGTTLGWGDATIMMGQYVSMLATEYALLDGRRPAEAQTTLRELHYALRALDRLDRTAESYFREDRTSAPDDLNGFFIRDDVAPDFLTRHPLGGGANAVASDTTAPYGGKPGYRATEMSQDQVWHLLVGLALVKTLVSFDGTLDGESIDVPAHAKTITHRILTYMREHDNWRTQNPIFGRDVLRGGDWDARRVFSYGFATAGNWILAPRDATEPSYPDLHNATSRGAKSAFVLAKLGKKDNYNQRALSTVGDINYFAGVFDHGSTRWKLEHETLSSKVYKYEQFPLIHGLLHGGKTRLDKRLYGGLLNAAPATGPFNHGDGTHSCAWSSVSRLVWPESNDAKEAWKQGDYNGIDYLLLHNLYQLTFNDAALTTLYGPRTK